MPLEDVLARVPFLGGWLAQERIDQQNTQSQLGQLLGVANLIETQKQRAMQQQEMQARLEHAQRQAQFEQAIPGLVQQATGEQGTDWAKLSTLLAQQPGGLKPAMDLRKTEEDRQARITQAEALVEQRKSQADQLHQVRLQNATTAEARAAEDARHNQLMEGLQRQSLAIRESNAGVYRAIAGNKQAPIVQTAEGIFERTPNGLVQLTDPTTGKPLRPASLTAGDRGDRRDAMGIYEKVEADPQVKTFKSITPKFDTSLSYFQTVQKDPSKQSNAQDLAMVKTFVAMIHPKGDQISNLDMKNIGQMPGLDERLVGAIVNVVDGKQLQPKMRADIMRLMASQYGNLNTQVIGIEDRRRQEAQQFGLDPDKAVPRIGRRQQAAQIAPVQQGAPRVIDFADLPGGR